MIQKMSALSALRRVCPQAFLFAGLIAASVTGLQAQTVTTNTTGRHNTFYYSYWRAGGTATMKLGAAGNYDLIWNGGNTVAGKGWNPGKAMSAHYNCGTWSPTGWARLSLYGWTKSPLIEYYIIEKWGGSGNSSGGSKVGTLKSDGSTYNISKHQQVNQPSIQGTQTFWQYFSVRQSQAPSGNRTITTGNHFNKWKSVLGSMGTFDYMILATEGFKSSGHSNVTVW